MNFRFSKLEVYDSQTILDDYNQLSYSNQISFQVNFESNIAHLQTIYKTGNISNEGGTKIVLESSYETIPKIYKWQIQFEQEKEYYNILTQNGFSAILATTSFHCFYAIQEKLKPLSYDSEIPKKLCDVIYDSGAAQFGTDKHGNVKILDFENVNLDILGLQPTKNLIKIFIEKNNAKD